MGRDDMYPKFIAPQNTEYSSLVSTNPNRLKIIIIQMIVIRLIAFFLSFIPRKVDWKSDTHSSLNV